MPLKTTDFARMLKLGLGRAVLYASEHDMTPYRDLILDGCLHNRAFNTQMEGSRARYMFDLIKRTPDFSYYRERILASLSALSDDDEDYDIQQQYDLARILAEGGDTQARQAIYDKFNANRSLGNFAGADAIVELDGLEGFVYATSRIGAAIQTDNSKSMYIKVEEGSVYTLIWILEEWLSEDDIEQTLLKLQQENPNIAAFLEAVRKQREFDKKWRDSISVDPAQVSYAAIKKAIEERESPPVSLAAWGEQVDEETLREAAQDFLNENDPKKLHSYIRIFAERAFPLDHTKLLMLTRHENERLAIKALLALEYVTHESVRNLALEMIQSNHMIGRAVGLLGRNFRDGDWPLIEAISERPDLDDEDVYSLGFSVRDVHALNPSRAVISILHNLYENSPHTNCREDFIKLLYQLDALPDWMREECRYDANSDIREAIEALGAGKIPEGWSPNET